MKKVSEQFKNNTGTPTARISVTSPTGSTVELGPSDIVQAAVSVASTDTAGVSFGNTASAVANLRIQRSKLPRVYTNQTYHVEFGYVLPDYDTVLSTETTVMQTSVDVYTGYVTTLYTWVKYADDANGTNMSDLPTGKKYVGLAYDKLVAGMSTNPADYKWSAVGTGVEQPEDPNKTYTWVMYADDTNGTNMSADPTDRKYVGLAYDKTSATPSTQYRDYSWSLFIDVDGIQSGTDSSTYENLYTWVKYADDANGTNMSDLPTGKKYVGVAWDKRTEKESTNPADYKWSAVGTGVEQPEDPTYTWVVYSDDPNGYNFTTTPGATYIGVAFDKPTPSPDTTNTSTYTWFVSEPVRTYGTTTEYVSMGWFATNDTLCSETGTYVDIVAYDAMYWLKSQKESFNFQPRGTETTTRQILNAILSVDNAKSLKVKDVTELPDVRLKRFRPTNSVQNALGNVALAGMRNVLVDSDGYIRFVTPKVTGVTFTTNNYSNDDGLSLSTNNPHTVNTIATTVTKAYDPIPERDEDGNIAKDDAGNISYVDVESVDETITKRAPNTATDLTWSIDGNMFCNEGTVNVDQDKRAIAEITTDIQTIISVGVANKSFPAQNKGYSLELFGGIYMEPFDVFDVVDVNGNKTTNLVAYNCVWTFDGALTTKLSATATTSDVETNTTLASVAGAVTNFGSQVLSLHSLTVNTISGQNATFNEMMADKISADEGVIKNLTSNIIETGTLNSTYLKTDVANMTNATIQGLLADTGTIKDLDVTDDLQVSGTLGAVTVTSENIDVGTLTVDRLQMLGDDGFYHAINMNSGKSLEMGEAVAKAQDSDEYKNYVAQKNTYDSLADELDDLNGQLADLDPDTQADEIAELQTKIDEQTTKLEEQAKVLDDAKDAYEATDAYQSYDKYNHGIHGDAIMSSTISADKISVTDLSAFGATIGGWTIGQDAIYTNTAGDDPRNSRVGTYLGGNGYTRLDASSDDGVEFTVDNTVVASIKKPTDSDVTTRTGSTAKLTINNAEVTDSMTFGKFAWVVRPSDGHTSLKILESE